MNLERRNNRSNDPNVALRRLCASVVDDLAVSDLVIGLPNGEVFVGADSGHSGAAFAALAPIIARTQDAPARRRMFGFLERLTGTRPAQTAFRTLRARGCTYHVAVRGRDFGARDKALSRMSAGLTRIL